MMPGKNGFSCRAVLLVLILLLFCEVFAAAQMASAQQVSGENAQGKGSSPAEKVGGGKSRLGENGEKERRGKERERRVRETERRKRETERRERETEQRQRQAEERIKEKEAKEDEGDSGLWGGLFPWADDGGFDDNWLSGLGLGLLGIVGALVTLYLFLGEFLPSMGGKAEYEKLRLEIEKLAQRREQQLEPREQYVRDGTGLGEEARQEATKLTRDLGEIIEHKEERARKVRRGLIAMGFPLYVILGGIFAVLAASTALQALLIGFGWTAIADRLGLKREEEKKKQTRAEEAATLSAEVKKAEKEKAEQEAEAAKLRETLKDFVENVTQK